MSNKKGINAFLGFILSIIIIIPVLFVVLVIFVYGSASVKSIVQSPQAYVSQTAVALTSGESVVVGSLAPSLSGDQFMAQFYGSSSCISLLDQLSRTGELTAPSDPTTLSGSYFICIGSYTTSNLVDSGWSDLPSSSNSASFPDWFGAATYLNSGSSSNTSGINGSQGTLSFFVNLPPSLSLGSSCTSFLNATTSFGRNEPSGYISALDCAQIPEKNGIPIFLSVKDTNCGSNCNDNPMAFLHGSPGVISLQECSYSGGNALVCQFDIG